MLKKQPHDISEISETRKHNLKTKKLNEQVLRVMQSLGIDPVRTTEVRKTLKVPDNPCEQIVLGSVRP